MCINVLDKNRWSTPCKGKNYIQYYCHLLSLINAQKRPVVRKKKNKVEKVNNVRQRATM